MTTAQLLANLAREGIHLEADGDRLRYFPRSAVSPGLLERIKADKPQLLALLRNEPQTAAPEATGSTETSANGPGRLQTPTQKPLDSQQTTGRAPFAEWVQRPDWEQPNLPEAVRWWAHSRFTDLAEPFTKPKSKAPGPGDCPRCGSGVWTDIPIHGGRSKRRDCGKCRRFLCFSVWYGKEA